MSPVTLPHHRRLTRGGITPCLLPPCLTRAGRTLRPAREMTWRSTIYRPLPPLRHLTFCKKGQAVPTLSEIIEIWTKNPPKKRCKDPHPQRPRKPNTANRQLRRELQRLQVICGCRCSKIVQSPPLSLERNVCSLISLT